MKRGNIFVDAEAPATGERFETLLALAHGRLVVERIVSSAEIAASEQRQPQDEWVLLVRGEAALDVAGESVALRAGDHLFLAAGTPHTVTSVSSGAIWLAVHLHPEKHAR